MQPEVTFDRDLRGPLSLRFRDSSDVVRTCCLGAADREASPLIFGPLLCIDVIAELEPVVRVLRLLLVLPGVVECGRLQRIEVDVDLTSRRAPMRGIDL